MNIVVIGEGAWGTALATILATNGHHVTIWCQDATIAHTINQEHTNTRYAAGNILSTSITATTDLAVILEHQYIVLTTPTVYIRNLLQQIAAYAKPYHKWLIASKGIEQDTLLFPYQIVQEFIPHVTYALLYGPSFAKEVMKQDPTAVMLASESSELQLQFKNIFENEVFRLYFTADTVGVSMSAAYKNIIAIASGMITGLKYGDNARALLFTCAVNELRQLIQSVRGSENTVLSLAGIGDLILTGYGAQSRNYQVGTELGSGKTLTDIQKVRSVLPEGLNTIASLEQWSRKKELPLPLVKTLYNIVYREQPASELITCITHYNFA